MQVQTEPSKLERTLSLSLAASDVESEINSRLKRIARTAKMPGFRPGKVPYSIVANQYGFQVRQEVMSDAVQNSFVQEVEKQKLRVAGFPRIVPVAESLGADHFEFTATFEIYPDFVVGSLAGKKLEKFTSAVTDKDVDHTIETLRKQQVSFEPVKRLAQIGDLVVIDFVGTMEGVPFKGGEAHDFSMVVGEGRMLPEFEAALIGMDLGITKTIDLTFPAEYQQDLAGKTAQFALTVKSISAPVLPSVDAAFARSLGVQDGDIEKMRAEVKANLERELKKKITVKIKDQVMDALLEVTEVSLPKSLVENEIARLQQMAAQDLQARGMTANDLQLPNELFKERAERRVKLGLILNEVISSQQLKAKPEQIRAIVEEHAESFEDPAQMVRWYYSDAKRLQDVEGIVLENNVVEWAEKQMDVIAANKTFDEIMEIKR